MSPILNSWRQQHREFGINFFRLFFLFEFHFKNDTDALGKGMHHQYLSSTQQLPYPSPFSKAFGVQRSQQASSFVNIGLFSGQLTENKDGW